MNKNIFNLKSILALLLVSIMPVSLASCSDNKKNTAFLDQISAAEEYSEEEESSEESVEPPTQEGYTARPIVTHVLNIEPYSVVVAGTCEEGSVIKAYNVAFDEEKYETKSIGNYFIFELKLRNTNEHYYEIKAVVEGKKESTVNYFTAQYNSVAEKPADGTAVSLGNNSTLFYDKTIAPFKGENLLTNTQLKNFKETIANNSSKEGIKYVYVMIPGRLSVYDEMVPESIKADKDSYNTKFEQVINALSGVNNVDVINLKDSFIENKNSDYPLYYNTSSNLSDFGAYLAYKEIMSYIGNSNDDFSYKFEKTEGKGGDLISSIGLDKDIFGETYYYAAKDFETTIPEDAESTCKISDIVVYSDKNTNTYFSDVAEDDIYGACEKLYFKTNRAELPSAVFLRDSSSNAMVSMLAENFNNSYFAANNSFTTTNSEITAAVSDYANEGSAYVDYVFVIVSEDNIDSIVAG